MAELEIDGLSISLVYVDFVLQVGRPWRWFAGENITENVKRIKIFTAERTAHDYRGGEATFKQSFDKINEERRENGQTNLPS